MPIPVIELPEVINIQDQEGHAVTALLAALPDLAKVDMKVTPVEQACEPVHRYACYSLGCVDVCLCGRGDGTVACQCHLTSNRSSIITLSHTLMKSFTKRGCPSLPA